MLKSGLVVQDYNPSYSEGRDRRMASLKPPWAIESVPYFKIIKKRFGGYS